MKKCPFCGAELADDNLFCTECGKELPQGNVCPHCGAILNEGDVFCTECGKRIDEVPPITSSEPIKSKCPHCGASIDEGDTFCTECGKKIEEEEQQSPMEEAVQVEEPKPIQQEATPIAEVEENDIVEKYEKQPSFIKKYLPYIIGGIIVLALIGGGWYGFKEYSAYSEKKQAREKFVADSLEQARKDSILMAEQKEKERMEAEKLAQFQEKLSFENFIGLLKHYDNPSYANRCGLTHIYRNDTEEEFGTCTEIVYGYDVEKGSKIDYGYDIVAKSNHACYFIYVLDTSTHAAINFKDEKDANLFYNKARDYGLIIYGDMALIPNKKLPNGKSITVDIDDESVSIYDMVCGGITSPFYADGWYVISIALDF